MKKFWFTVPCHGEPIKIGINRNMQVELAGYDPEYEQAMVEFGETPSPCKRIIGNWDYAPIEVLLKEVPVPIHVKELIFADWTEHLIDISIPNIETHFGGLLGKEYEKPVFIKHIDGIRESIGFIRRYLATHLDSDISYKIKLPEVGRCYEGRIYVLDIRDKYSDFRDRILHIKGPHNTLMYRAASCIITMANVALAIHGTGKHPPEKDTIDSLVAGASYIPYTVPKILGGLDPRPGHVFIEDTPSNREVRWEIRRFCDVCLKLERKRKYPMLTETT